MLPYIAHVFVFCFLVFFFSFLACFQHQKTHESFAVGVWLVNVDLDVDLVGGPSLLLFSFSLSYLSLSQEWKIDTNLSSRGGVATASKNKNGDTNGDHQHASGSAGGRREIWL